MIPETTITEILNKADIVDIISQYVKLKRAGANYKGSCPFHKEKTASFMVSPSKQIYKCFGCGEGGNVFKFIMLYDKLSFPEAIRKIAGIVGVTIEEKKQTDEEKKAAHRREALFKAMEIVSIFYSNQLISNIKAKQYILKRWNEEAAKIFNLGYAPAGKTLLDFIKQSGLKKELLIELGLIRTGRNGQEYDFFRERIIFPIHDQYGRSVGFTGRDISGNSKTSKYINLPENDIYKKRFTLYGLHTARKSIIKNDYTYLVEGQPDVIRLQSLEINNTVATGGTELTDEQIKIIGRLTKNVTFIEETDSPGQEALKKNAKKLIKVGFMVQVISLPKEKDKAGEFIKHDADSFFQSKQQFEEFKAGNSYDFILYYAGIKIEMASGNTAMMGRAINNICELVAAVSDLSMREYYIDELARMKKPKNIWTSKIRSILQEAEPDIKKEQPKDIDSKFYEKYGFYEKNNAYYFDTRSGIRKGSNFIMRPLFHIKSVNNAKRLYEISNQLGYTETIELEQRDLVSLSRFRERIESIGNFIWSVTETELIKLKSYLYEKTDICTEVSQLGWNKAGFFAWGNGIFNDKFTKIDKYGIIEHNGENYYIPAFSCIYQGEEQSFVFERKFIHKEGSKITLNEWASQFIKVYGDNAIICICFYIATLFRDVIFQRFGFFPILNMFGEKGAGKTACAVSMLQLFGKFDSGPNLNNTTIPAMSDYVAQMCNALAHLDEWRNDVDMEKVEFCKGIWNAIGRTRKNRDDFKKNETTRVDAGVILTGQQMPTADIALFSRLIFLSFTQTEYSLEEKEEFQNLKKMEAKGLTHLTNQILALRPTIIDLYSEAYKRVIADLSDKINTVVEDRIFLNWAVIIAVFRALVASVDNLVNEIIDLPFTYNEVIKLSAKKIQSQNAETKSSNEVTTFWKIIQSCAHENELKEEFDYKIVTMDRIKLENDEIEFAQAKTILIINDGMVLPLYRKAGARMKENVLPRDTMQYYLQNSKAFIGKKRENFRRSMVDNITQATWKTTRSMVFDYNKIDIDLPNYHDNQENIEYISNDKQIKVPW